jgi:hypothetical protein
MNTRTRSPNTRRTVRPACGTRAGYECHLRRTERPCARCLVGSVTYSDDEILALATELRDKERDRQLWNKHRITLDTFSRIFAEQDHRCACCGTADPAGPWYVDHDHRAGLIRGILCSECNAGIEMLGDNLDGLRRAASYLEGHLARGGYPSDPAPRGLQSAQPRPSAQMRRCFEFFSQGLSLDKVVVLMRLTPEVVEEIFALWKNGGARLEAERRQLEADRRHYFQVPKDPPMRFVCACGYEAVCTDASASAIEVAIESVNLHIKEAGGQ